MRLFQIALILVSVASPFVAAADDTFDVANAGGIVEFHIPVGTGQRAWNTPQTVVEVKVGQTLRIYNDDSIAHYLHTPGRPCPHGTGRFNPGSFYDCQVSAEADPERDECYDHQFGPSSRFYVKATGALE